MMYEFFKLFSRLNEDRQGATAIEYGLIAALVAVVVIAAITLMGSSIGNTFNSVANNLSL